MSIEYELRTLNISIQDMISTIQMLGAEYVGTYHQRRYVYDYKPAQKGKWIRLRSNGTQHTLTTKEIQSNDISGTVEVEIEVSDFDDTNLILQNMGFEPRTYQENLRIEFKLDNIVFDIDKWPMIPPYLEIEGDSEISVRKGIAILGMDKGSFIADDVDVVYQAFYGINLDSIKELRFTDEEIKEIKQIDLQVDPTERIINIQLENGFEDCYELMALLNENNLDARIIENKNDQMMGGLFEGLVVCLPLLLPYVEQLRSIIEIYLKYKRPYKSNYSITLTNGKKKLKIEASNMEIPSADEIISIFNQKRSSSI